MLRRTAVVLAFWTCVISSSSAQTAFLYAPNETDGTISAYIINPTSGALTAIPGSPFAGVAGNHMIVIHPSQRFAYLPNEGSNTVSGYAINPNTGSLSPLSGSPYPAGTNPTSLAVDPGGNFLYAVYRSSNIVTGYTINQTTGALTSISGSPFPMPGAASGFWASIDPQSKFLYVASNDSGNISAFAINQVTGSISPISGSPFSAGSNLGWDEVYSSGQFLYVADFGFGSGDVIGFSLNPTTGGLSLIPGSVANGTGPHGGAIDPTGRFLYIGAEYNGISGYAINATTGVLTAIPGSSLPAGSVPTGVAIDPSGHFVYVGNVYSANISGYSINTTTGALTSIGTFLAGNGPENLAIASGGPTVNPFVLPSQGGNSGAVTVQVVGSGFEAGAGVKLTGIGADIIGSNVTLTGPTSLTTTFALNGEAPGVRDLVVTNLDGTMVTLMGAFTIEQGGAAQISVSVAGRSQIRIGTPQSYFVVVTNTGNVDATPGLISFSVPSPVQFAQISGTSLFAAGITPDPEFEIPSAIPTGDTQNLLYASPGVTAGQATTVLVQLTLPPGTPDAPTSTSFTLQAAWQPDLANLTVDQFLGLEAIPFIPLP